MRREVARRKIRKFLMSKCHTRLSPSQVEWSRWLSASRTHKSQASKQASNSNQERHGCHGVAKATARTEKDSKEKLQTRRQFPAVFSKQSTVGANKRANKKKQKQTQNMNGRDSKSSLSKG
jgi:hypothetical protein